MLSVEDCATVFLCTRVKHVASVIRGVLFNKDSEPLCFREFRGQPFYRHLLLLQPAPKLCGCFGAGAGIAHLGVRGENIPTAGGEPCNLVRANKDDSEVSNKGE